MKSHTLKRRPIQHTCRPLVVIALAACSWSELTLAQDANPAAPATTPDATAPSASGVTKPATDAATPTTPTAPSTTEKPASPFRTGESTTGAGAVKKSPFGYNAGDDETPRKKSARSISDATEAEEANGDAPKKSGGDDGSDSRIVAPGFYGHSPRVVTPGHGIYAGPKYRFGASAGIGYDDNTDQTPTVNLSAVARPRTRSGFTWVNGHFDAQWLKPRTIFTLNVEAGGDFYWNRPGNSSDANARLALLYVNKINQRTQFTANGSFAYLSQPDYSNLFASTSAVTGDYFTGSLKFDLSYHWDPRFSTNTSVSANVLKYVNDKSSTLSNSYWNFVVGNEFRFLASHHITWVAEGRFGFNDYFNNFSLNSQSFYALGGLDWIASRRLTGYLRTGAEFRSYDIGGSSNSPFVEFSLNYLTSSTSTLSLNGRYGFEQSNTAGDENMAFRLGLFYQQSFTKNLSGNANVNFIHSDFKPRAGASSSTTVYDLGVGLQYRIDRHFSLGLHYSYTLQDSSSGLQDFDRSRVLFSGQYEY